MLGDRGIQPVTVVLNSSKNCFIHLPTNLISQLSLAENQVLELSWGESVAPVYLSWTKCLQNSNRSGNTVEVNRQLGDKLGIKDGEQGFLRPCQQVRSVQQVMVEPLSSDDWEILELHSSALEQQLLDQIRVVFPAGVFPVWVNQRTVVYIQIASLSPSVPYGHLEPLTELVVSPKAREGGDHPATGQPRPEDAAEQNQSPRLQRQKIFEIPKSPTFSQLDTLEPSVGGVWGGVSRLQGLLRYMLKGRVSPEKEVLTVPSIPPLHRDAVFRVCRAPPLSVGYSGPMNEAVNVYPWGHCVDKGDQSYAAITYGRISCLRSAKELRERTKQANEKKRGAETTPSGERGSTSDEAQVQPLVVKVVCHCAEEILAGRNSCSGRRLYSGRVWVSTAS